MNTISVIIPTVGRDSLLGTLESLLEAGIGPQDEVVLVIDGRENEEPARQALAHSLIEAIVPARVHVFGEQQGDWGHPARNMGVRLAAKDWLVFTQDDNMLSPGGLVRVRSHARLYPGVAHLYRVIPNCGLTVPSYTTPGGYDHNLTGPLAMGTVDGDCLVVHRSHIGVWGTGYNGDYDWIETVVMTYPKGWQDVVYHQGGLLSYHQRLAGRVVPAQEGWLLP